MKFSELQKGKIYTDKDGVYAYQFVGMRNDQLATFKACEYDEEKGDYIASGKIIYFTVNEVKHLI